MAGKMENVIPLVQLIWCPKRESVFSSVIKAIMMMIIFVSTLAEQVMVIMVNVWMNVRQVI